MATVTVRVEAETRDVLKELAAMTGTSIAGAAAEATECYRRKLFLARMNEEYAALRADPEAWAQELEERRAWEATLSDGLDRE
jgi:hypothetical protein